ncbi:(d)CMP kinase [Flagellimonas sp. S3867]|uniref:(d)CMP kinase n=1 Tax=Flagellimonas sp. S3867 TaxID=2768063 RepID=UPI0016871B22|nr:(d)CMP kinase [Flagellimonas sp. S3867]
MGKITVAIDGYSSTGKSTIAKQLAKALNYIYVDTGAMYRAVTLYAIQHNYVGDQEDIAGLVNDLPDIKLKFVPNKALEISEMHLNGKNVEREIRNMEVSSHVSKVATIPEVRHKLVEMQQQMDTEKGIVMDGRDIGTVVFPDAELKLFMTASPEARATRRYKELLERGEVVSYEEVLENVQKRDFIDSTRKTSPLRKADDAIEFDNSDMGLAEQFERVFDYTKRIIAEKS